MAEVVTATGVAPAPAPGDLVGALVARLSGEAPNLVLVHGDPGSGKSILLRTIVQQLAGSVTFVAYRVTAGSATAGASDGGTNPTIALLLLDAAQVIAAGAAEREPPEVEPVSVVSTKDGEGPDFYPPQLAAALQGMVESGGGTLVVDSWDRRTEETYRHLSGVAVGGLEVTARARVLQEQLGRVPVPTIIAIFGQLDPSMVSMSDCAITLTHEQIDGTAAHIVVVEKSAADLGVPERQLFTTRTGEFYCPPARVPPPIGAIRPPDPDPAPEPGTQWPGSAEYARVFGRLRYNAFTGIELFDEVPNAAAGAFGFPMIAYTLLTGGRVVWIPSPMMSPGRITRILAGAVPPEQIQQNLRVLSAGTNDPTLGDLRSIALPVRRAMPKRGDARLLDPPTVEPAFPDAYTFLKNRPGDGTSLFVLSLDGLRALAVMTGTAYDPSTFPLIVEQYARISHFHGIGFARAGDPLGQGLLPAAETWIRLRQRYGHVVATGMRPTTPAHLIDWRGPMRDFALLSLA
jgi:hypothetical protein